MLIWVWVCWSYANMSWMLHYLHRFSEIEKKSTEIDIIEQCKNTSLVTWATWGV
jgi:hypothetical protein